MYDVIAVGESLIDFTPAGKTDPNNLLFACNPGGAPANVLAMATKLGAKTAFLGKVGQDAFGSFLRENMLAAGIDVQGLQMDPLTPTTLAFVHLDANGERSFSFYRKPGADIMLRFEEIDKNMLASCRIFHFGGVSLTDEPCRTTTLESAKYAQQKGACISYDPNYRPSLWESEAEAKRIMGDAIALSDILKVSDNELKLFTGCDEILKGIQQLKNMGPKVVFVTCGEEGAFVCSNASIEHIPTAHVDVVDTTGAGDAFLGSMLWQLLFVTNGDLDTITPDEWKAMLRFSNAAGSLTVTRKGAIPALPSHVEIANVLQWF